MKIAEPLLPYEIVMLVAGAILFIVLVVLLVVRVVQNRSFALLLPFFFLPIAMIGFPAVKVVKVGDSTLELKDEVRRLASKPAGAISMAERAELRLKVDELRPRVGDNPEALILVAQAETLLGNVDAGRRTVDEVLRLDPGSPVARDLQTRVVALEPNQTEALRKAVQANAALAQ